MDRLTEWRGKNASIANHHVDYIERLARYEDTGLTPEEVLQLKGECFGWKTDAEKYRQAENEGRVIVLPCKLGDPVWVLTKKGSIKAYEIGGAIIDPNNIWMDAKEIGGISGAGLLNCLQFGIDVFLTREEAERALDDKK